MLPVPYVSLTRPVIRDVLVPELEGHLPTRDKSTLAAKHPFAAICNLKPNLHHVLKEGPDALPIAKIKVSHPSEDEGKSALRARGRLQISRSGNIRNILKQKLAQLQRICMALKTSDVACQPAMFGAQAP